MSSRQKRPGTTSPQERLEKAIDKRLNNAARDKKRRPNTKPKSGSKADRRRTHDPKQKVRLHRRPGNKKKIEDHPDKPEDKSDKDEKKKDKKKIKEGVRMDIVGAIRYILENHGQDVDQVVSNYNDKKALATVATKCMATCLSGWKETEFGLVSEHTDMVLSKNSWVVAEDGSAELENGFKFDYDWLYELSNATKTLTEAVDSIDDQVRDQDAFSDTLTNAAALLRKLSDKEVKKYILNAAKQEDDVDVMNLKEVLENTGVNWKFVGAEVDGEKINLLIKVKYSTDGTQEGVVEKKLSIEVKPSIADVTETEKISDKELNLSFAQPYESEPNESEEKPETDDEREEIEIEGEDLEIEPDTELESEEEPEAGIDNMGTI